MLPAKVFSAFGDLPALVNGPGMELAILMGCGLSFLVSLLSAQLFSVGQDLDVSQCHTTVSRPVLLDDSLHAPVSEAVRSLGQNWTLGSVLGCEGTTLVERQFSQRLHGAERLPMVELNHGGSFHLHAMDALETQKDLGSFRNPTCVSPFRHQEAQWSRVCLAGRARLRS